MQTVNGYVIYTPDGEVMVSTFRKDKQECIDRFLYNFNQSRYEDSKEDSEPIYWSELVTDGYSTKKSTLSII